MTETEHSIAVLFDVTAADRLAAARLLSRVLAYRGGLLPQIQELSRTGNRGEAVESWSFPEADLKSVDGNDRAAMRLVPDHDANPVLPYVVGPDLASQRVNATVEAYRQHTPGVGNATCVRDLLVDLDHWCAERGLNLTELADGAKTLADRERHGSLSPTQATQGSRPASAPPVAPPPATTPGGPGW